ncbi:MAG: glycine cleavage system protein GcvH [Candidatus Bipolaricaulia bacterium]
MAYPAELRYTKEHEWVKAENGTVVMGITDFAQDELGDVVFVELPEEGAEVQQDDAIITVESVKAASDVYAPVSGTVAEVNSDLEDQPELVNESPHDSGWMARIEMNDASELDSLMSADEYEEHIGSE